MEQTPLELWDSEGLMGDLVYFEICITQSSLTNERRDDASTAIDFAMTASQMDYHIIVFC